MKHITYSVKRFQASVISGILCFGVMAQSNETKFNDNWAFALGDYPEAKNPEFKADKWQRLSLPHDWSIQMPFDKETPAGNDGGYLPTGIGWYRNTLQVPKGTLDKKRKLDYKIIGILHYHEKYLS